MECNKGKEHCSNKALNERKAYFIAMDIITINVLIHSIHYTTNDFLFYLEIGLLVLASGVLCFKALTAS